MYPVSFDLGDRTPAGAEVLTCDLLGAVFNWPFRASGVAKLISKADLPKSGNKSPDRRCPKHPSFSFLKRTAVRL